MKKFGTALLIICAIFLAASAQERRVSDDSTAAPKMAIDSTAHDFGKVKAGTALTHSFKIKNTGTADLQIQSVTPG